MHSRHGEEKPFTIFVDGSAKSVIQRRVSDQGELVLTIQLAASFQFRQLHFVRLLAVSGVDRSAGIHVSFADLQPYDDGFERCIGFSDLPSTHVPTPISGNAINSCFTLSIRPRRGSLPFTHANAPDISIALQILPVGMFQGSLM